MRGVAERGLLVIMAVTLAMLPGGAQGRGAAEAVNELALRLYDTLSTADTSKNVFFSPLSVATAFSFVNLGARGATRQQLEEVFGFGGRGVAGSLRKGTAVQGSPEGGVEFLLGNRLFLEEGFEVEGSFRERLAAARSGVLEEAPFSEDPEGSRLLVNEFVSNLTRGHIEDLMPEGSVTEDTRLVIANAMFFKGGWEFPFEEVFTSPMPFQGFEGSTTVNMMARREVNLRVGRIPGAQVLELPYRDATASMVIVLPDDHTSEAFLSLEDDLKKMAITDLLENNDFDEVNVYLPRFSVEDSADLKSVLAKLGVADLFVPGVADLSGIATTSPPLFVSSAIHKAKIVVDEQGTVASAATGITISLESIPLEPPIEFKVDHPFIYFLIDNRSSTVLFMGNVRGLPE